MKSSWLGLLALTFAAAVAAAPSAPVSAQEQMKQIRLTEKHITQFIGAQKDMGVIQKKLPPQPTGPADPKIIAEFEAAAKKHGFASFTEFDEVAANISMIMSGLDPQTGAYTDPQAAIRKEMEEIKADKSMKDQERKQILDELAEALKAAEPVRFPENIELVKRFRQQIDAAMQ